jgi:hypothetical protein
MNDKALLQQHLTSLFPHPKSEPKSAPVSRKPLPGTPAKRPDFLHTVKTSIIVDIAIIVD